MNKLRFKDGKGDPRGFKAFLEEKNLPKMLLPRYRGNRLHIIFKISGLLIEHHDVLREFFESGTSCGGLRSSILKDFNTDQAKLELLVLGLLGKLLSGPWMTMFYVAPEDQMNHIDGITVVKDVIAQLKEATSLEECSAPLLTRDTDFLGQKLPEDDSTLDKLRQFQVSDRAQLDTMLKAAMTAVVQVLERQYAKYFSMDVTDKLREEVESARAHNIDAEEIMGMFSAAQQKAPNATLCFLSCRMRAIKNRTVDYLDEMDPTTRDDFLGKAITYGRKQRDQRRKCQKDLRAEIIRRQQAKKQARDAAKRKELERKLKKSLSSVVEEMSISAEDRVLLEDIINGKVVGRDIVHVWSDNDVLTTFNGRIEKLKAKTKYRVSYWGLEESHDDAEDYDITKYELAVDFILGDLVVSH